MPDQVIPCSLKVAVGVGNFGSSQVWAYLKLMLHLHATPSLIHCHSGSQRPFSAFAQASCSHSASLWAQSFDELNIAATWKFISWKSADVWSWVRSVIPGYRIDSKMVKSSSLHQPFVSLDLTYCFQFYLPGIMRRKMSKCWCQVYQRLQ